MLYGFDAKTRNLHPGRYSDGGACSVGNLLSFPSRGRRVLVIVEVGHKRKADNAEARLVQYVALAPIHALPADAFRIENLGTEQLRLNATVRDLVNRIDWSGDTNAFFDFFIDLAIDHYRSVSQTAEERIVKLDRFGESGYRDLPSKL